MNKEKQEEESVPFGSWRNFYAVVLAEMIVLSLVFFAITRYYQ